MTDPTTRYYAETPCETCRGTGWIPDDPDGWDVPDMSMSGCPDCQPKIGGTGIGSRTLLTVREVDYEAISQTADLRCDHDGHTTWFDRPGSFGNAMGQGPGDFCEHCVALWGRDRRKVVQAALGGSVVLVEEGE